VARAQPPLPALLHVDVGAGSSMAGNREVLGSPWYTPAAARWGVPTTRPSAFGISSSRKVIPFSASSISKSSSALLVRRDSVIDPVTK
jgi:hypothetical protein